MKKILLTLVTIISLASCTQVVDIPLDNSLPKLVVEANLKWQKGTSGNDQTVKLTTTTSFYKKNVPLASGAIVIVTNSKTKEIFNFIEDENSGVYNCSDFKPIMNDPYSLKVTYKGTTYEGSEKLMPVTPITDIVQENNGGLNNKQIRVKANYIDPQITADYYLYKYSFTNIQGMKPDYYVADDLFYNGNLGLSLSFKDDIKVGDTINISHFGISQQYYNYLNILFSLAGGGGGGPFPAPPVSVRGNLTNKLNENDFPFGYFSLSEVDTKEYIVK